MNKIKRILFIDDDAIIGLVTKRLIEQMQVAEEVLVYTDSLEALLFMKAQFHPSAYTHDERQSTLVFIDIEMPGYGAFELLSFVHKAALAGELVLENTYFVVVTSHKGDKEMIRASAFDILAIIEKPLKQQDIHNLVEKIL